MADVFISYKKKDRALVEALVQDLEAEGFTVWWDYEIDSGDDWLERILKEVDVARCVVGVWTRAAVSPNGTFIPSEGTGINYVRIEHERGARKLAPALCEAGTTLPVQFADLQTADLRDRRPGDRTHKGFRALVERIEAFATPSWVQTRLTAMEAKLSQEQSRRNQLEQRAKAVEAEMKAAADALAKERLEWERTRPEATPPRPQAGRLATAAAAALLVGLGAGWGLKPAAGHNPAVETAAGVSPDVTAVTAVAPPGAILAGVWGGADFSCESLPVHITISENQLGLAIGGPPAFEALGPMAADGWFESVGEGAANFWRRDADALLWRTERVDNAASETRLTPCEG
jgi:TIR domain